jgi:hypothetical protein
MDVIQAMNNGGYSSGVAAAILDDCYHPATDFVKIQFEHDYRESNSVAHELARLTRGKVQLVWLENPPISIIPLLISDVTSITTE